MNDQTLPKGLFGIAGSSVAVISNHWDTVEAVKMWLPWGLGVAVALATLTSIAMDVRRKWKDRNKP